jgi:tripartite-type tricarboxylate transporter receptor subunit TctC
MIVRTSIFSREVAMFFHRVALVLLAGTALTAQAQFPDKPIRYIVPSAAGGGADVLSRLLAEVNKACVAPTLVEKLTVVGNRCVGSTPEEFGALVRKEYVKWVEVVKRSGARVD